MGLVVRPAELVEICLALPQAFESFPFGEETSVFKTSGNGKVFAITALAATPLSITLKCDPEDSIALREQYVEITPGYHMNKKHWISVNVDGELPRKLVEELVFASFALVRPRL
jgi:predicted DNA-binding protein (MmcQ/YjbR family)